VGGLERCAAVASAEAHRVIQRLNTKTHRIEFTPAGARRDYLITAELNGAVPIVGAVGVGALRTAGMVLLQVGTAFVVPTDGQLYEPTDGAVTVPTEVTDCP